MKEFHVSELFPEKTELQVAAQLLVDVMMNPEAGPLNAARLKQMNAKVYEVARRESGMTSQDLADETQESTTRYKLYWVVASQLLAQVCTEAANRLSVYEGWNR